MFLFTNKSSNLDYSLLFATSDLHVAEGAVHLLKNLFIFWKNKRKNVGFTKGQIASLVKIVWPNYLEKNWQLGKGWETTRDSIQYMAKALYKTKTFKSCSQSTKSTRMYSWRRKPQIKTKTKTCFRCGSQNFVNDP